MIILLLHLLRLLPFLGGGHRQLALANLALRQQLAVYKRTANRPKLQRSDRLLWVWLSGVWPAWKQGPSSSWLPPSAALAATPLSPPLGHALRAPPGGPPARRRRDQNPGQKNGHGQSPVGCPPESMATSSSSASTSLSAPSPVCSRSA